jgi:hypothetical protein
VLALGEAAHCTPLPIDRRCTRRHERCAEMAKCAQLANS